jgi:hypothetical protein
MMWEARSSALFPQSRVPNFDGFVELVGLDHRPIGKLDIQIRKIDDDATSATCDERLVAYSTVNGLPLVYVGVDVKNRRAYWRHVTFPMPEMREGRKSCTIKFDPGSDQVGPGMPYIERWVELAKDYRHHAAPSKFCGHPLLEPVHSRSLPRDF